MFEWGETLARGAVFAIQAGHQFGHAGQVINGADALASRPHGLPGLGLVADRLEFFTVIDLALVLQALQVLAGSLQALAHKAGRNA